MEWYRLIDCGGGGFPAFRPLQWVIGRAINMTVDGRVFMDIQLELLGARDQVPNACVIEFADRVSVNWAETSDLDNQSKRWAKDQMMP